MKRTRMAHVLLTLAIIPIAGLGAGQKVLPGVFEPEAIRVSGDELFVVEGPTILVYSLNDARLIRKIGGPGEGPGEFKPADFWYNTVTVLPDGIFVDGYDKTVRFSREGRLLAEAKKPLGISRMVPVGRNFAAVKLDHIEGDVQYQCLRLFDGAGNLLKELCRQESPVQSLTHRTEMIPDVLNFAVGGDKIFVDKSREGFVIDVFDADGAFLIRVEKKTAKVAVTEERKNEALEHFKSDPFVKRIGFEQFKSFSTLVWPETLPAIRDLSAADGRIYVRTSGTRDGQEAWMILDAQGAVLGQPHLPRVEEAPLMAALNGVAYHTVHDRKLYFIKPNERTDEWELFVEEIK